MLKFNIWNMLVLVIDDVVKNVLTNALKGQFAT